MTKISILGCGWLGLPLAKALIGTGFSIKGSTTSIEKLPILEFAGIEPFLISLHANEIEGNIVPFLENSEILIIDIPLKLRGNSNDPSATHRAEFVGKIRTLIPYIENSSIENVLFISSTSVYGEANTIITEETTPNPDTESGKQLFQAEQLLQNNRDFKTTIVRFGGLIGEDRHPIRFLSGRDNIDNPEAPINFIHQDDCIGIIQKIIETNCWGETFNAVSPFHPSRETYYTQKAIGLNLALPKFSHAKPSVGKTILSDKVETVLKYKFTRTTL
ncbi:SDR family oxidoreductase [Flavobacterium psychrotolerans]|uniref:NAD(P)-dependent oxidoreductase n=1 Tax=Flavobacterium psychrotolerans TaxID=2169410 RepID=A0A2U1JP14_9FLAO|nr:SDR family oxidoreductase [Flavobacterium psychrotolerans]PWA06578.1 NAD(P)-dependent oxidoreductase [Flavobacterium psychrotolerans]